MDEREIKKLAIILIVAIVIIMLFKYLLTRTYSDINKVNIARKPLPAVVKADSPTPVVASAVPAPAAMVDPAPVEAASAVANVPAGSAQSQ